MGNGNYKLQTLCHSIYNCKTIFLNQIIGGCFSTKKPEIISCQSLTIKLVPCETYETMSLIISSCLI